MKTYSSRVIDNREEWNSLIELFPEVDFFHTWSYHELYANFHEGEPWMFVVLANEKPVIALPTIRRNITIQTKYENLFDLVSVYGYSGLLLNEDVDLNNGLSFAKSKLKDLGCVSIFSRLHPLINEKIVDIEGVFESGRTIGISLTQSDTRFETYRKSTRYDIRRLIKEGAIVSFDDSSEAFDQFFSIYCSTMSLLGADEFYYFKNAFLKALLELPDSSVTIGRVILNDRTVSAGLFTSHGKIAQYFLGGATKEYSKFSPQKLLLHKACDWAQKQGAKVLHLGGGRGSSEDSLFKFKEGFSSNYYSFKLFKVICDPKAYDVLSETHRSALDVSKSQLSECNYFPKYRAESQHVS